MSYSPIRRSVLCLLALHFVAAPLLAIARPAASAGSPDSTGIEVLQDRVYTVDLEVRDWRELLLLQELGLDLNEPGSYRFDLSPELVGQVQSLGLPCTVIERAVRLSFGPVALAAAYETYEHGLLQWDVPFGPSAEPLIGSTDTLGAPADAIITRVRYRIQVDHGYPGMLAVAVRSHYDFDYWVWDRIGGDTDGGLDDDVESDDDVYLDRTVVAPYAGRLVQSTWYVKVHNYSTTTSGTFRFLEIWAYYDVPDPPATPTPTRTAIRTPTPTQANPLRPVHGTVRYNGALAPTGSQLKAKCSTSECGSIWTGANGTYQIYVGCTDGRSVSFQLTPPGKPAVACQTTWTCAPGNPIKDLACNDALPDLEAVVPGLDPIRPVVAESTMLYLQYKNVGGDYAPTYAGDNATVIIKLKAPSTGHVWTYEFLTHIPALLSGETRTIEYGPLIFTSEDITAVEWTLYPSDPERTNTNNTAIRDHVEVQEALQDWTSCAMLPIDCFFIWLDLHTLGEASASKDLAKIMVQQMTNITLSCQEQEFGCFRAGISMVVDCVAFLIEHGSIQFSPVGAFISVAKSFIEAIWDAWECGTYLGTIARLYVDNVQFRGYDINLAQILSPAYVMVIDNQGRKSGFNQYGTLYEQIPGTEILNKNGHKAVLYPGTNTERIEVYGTDDSYSSADSNAAGESTFDLLVSVSMGGSVQHLAYEDVAVTSASRGYVDVNSGDLRLAMDDNGDGSTDRWIGPQFAQRNFPNRAMLPMIRK